MVTSKPVAAGFVADICLYGSSHSSGWIVCMADGRMAGNGEPKHGHGLTQSVWTAIGAIEAVFGVKAGRVRVFEPSGRRMAEMAIANPRTFGDLKWQAAPVYTISAAELIAAAEKERS